MAGDLQERGARLYAHLARGVTDEGTLALAEEAARLADRLDDLDRIIAGKGVLQLLRFRLMDDDGRVAEVKFDNVLAEARQQGQALRAILTTLGVGKAAQPEPSPRGNPLDELAKILAGTGAGAASS